MLDEQLCDTGDPRSFRGGDGDIAMLTHIKPLVQYLVPGVVCNQRVGDADAQTTFDHGQNGMVTAHLVLHRGRIGNPLQEMGDLVVRGFMKLDKGSALQLLNGKNNRIRKDVIFGEHRHQLIPHQKVGVQIVGRGQADKAAVHLSVADVAFDFRVGVQVDQLKFNFRIFLLKGFSKDWGSTYPPRW